MLQGQLQKIDCPRFARWGLLAPGFHSQLSNNKFSVHGRCRTTGIVFFGPTPVNVVCIRWCIWVMGRTRTCKNHRPPKGSGMKFRQCGHLCTLLFATASALLLQLLGFRKRMNAGPAIARTPCKPGLGTGPVTLTKQRDSFLPLPGDSEVHGWIQVRRNYDT